MALRVLLATSLLFVGVLFYYYRTHP